MIRLLLRLRDRGTIRPDCNAGVVGRLLFNAMNMAFTGFVRNDAEGVEALLDGVNSQTAFVAAQLGRT